MTQTPSTPPEAVVHALFCGAAHPDRLGRAHQALIDGASNPGTFIERAGGAALNSASVFAQLGGTAGLITILGKDSAAEVVLQSASERTLDVMAQRGDRTASYTALLEPNGDLALGMADMAIYDAFDVDMARERIAELGASDWLFVDANLAEPAVFALAETAKCWVACTTTSTAKASRLRRALPHIDLLFTNRNQATALFETDEDGLEAALVSPNLPTIVMTDGAEAVLMISKGKTTDVAVPIKSAIRDVTGAGDALAGGCLYGLASGMSMNQAVKLGISAAQAILEVDGPWRPDLHETVSG